jgi:hypothetical protein
MIKNKRIKKNWSEEDVKILIWLISKYADINHYHDVERDLVIFTFTLDALRLVIYGYINTRCHSLILYV